MKRLCGSCGCRFYDMGKTPIVCPKCGAAYEHEPTFKTRRSSVTAETKSKVQPLLADDSAGDLDVIGAMDDEDAIEDDVEVEGEAGEEEDETLIEDASDLGEDDDDMAEVMEHLDEGPEDEA
jgi:uncharacterized protein (TIGR02300 family)